MLGIAVVMSVIFRRILGPLVLGSYCFRGLACFWREKVSLYLWQIMNILPISVTKQASLRSFLQQGNIITYLKSLPLKSRNL